MKASNKTLAIFSVLIMLILFEQGLVVRCDTASLQDKALAYVENVLPFDINHYNITIKGVYSLPSAPNDPTKWQAGDVDLKSSDSEIHVACLFFNGALRECGVSITSGTPISDKPYSNLKEMAIQILEKHQEQTGFDSTKLINALNLVDETKSMNVTYEDVILTVSHFLVPISLETVNGMPVPNYSNAINSTSFEWTYVINGISYNSVSLRFDKNILHDLRDDRAAYQIGGTEVDITKEQAISNVEQYLSNYTNKFNLNIFNATAKLISYPRNYTTLYPTWWVLVYFSQTNVQSVDVKVWADTGELYDPYQGGSPPNMSQLVTIPTSAQQPQPSPTSTRPTATYNPSNETSNAEMPPSTSTPNQIASGSSSVIQSRASSIDLHPLTVSIAVVAIVIYVIVLIAVATYEIKNQTQRPSTKTNS